MFTKTPLKNCAIKAFQGWLGLAAAGLNDAFLLKHRYVDVYRDQFLFNAYFLSSVNKFTTVTSTILHLTPKVQNH